MKNSPLALELQLSQKYLETAKERIAELEAEIIKLQRELDKATFSQSRSPQEE